MSTPCDHAAGTEDSLFVQTQHPAHNTESAGVTACAQGTVHTLRSEVTACAQGTVHTLQFLPTTKYVVLLDEWLVSSLWLPSVYTMLSGSYLLSCNLILPSSSSSVLGT